MSGVKQITATEAVTPFAEQLAALKALPPRTA